MEFRARSCCLDRHENSLVTEQRVPLYFVSNNEPRRFEGGKSIGRLITMNWFGKPPAQLTLPFPQCPPALSSIVNAKQNRKKKSTEKRLRTPPGRSETMRPNQRMWGCITTRRMEMPRWISKLRATFSQLRDGRGVGWKSSAWCVCSPWRLCRIQAEVEEQDGGMGAQCCSIGSWYFPKNPLKNRTWEELNNILFSKLKYYNTVLYLNSLEQWKQRRFSLVCKRAKASTKYKNKVIGRLLKKTLSILHIPQFPTPLPLADAESSEHSTPACSSLCPQHPQPALPAVGLGEGMSQGMFHSRCTFFGTRSHSYLPVSLTSTNWLLSFRLIYFCGLSNTQTLLKKQNVNQRLLWDAFKQSGRQRTEEKTNRSNHFKMFLQSLQWHFSSTRIVHLLFQLQFPSVVILEWIMPK